jgi:hypothetical protein
MSGWQAWHGVARPGFAPLVAHGKAPRALLAWRDAARTLSVWLVARGSLSQGAAGMACPGGDRSGSAMLAWHGFASEA